MQLVQQPGILDGNDGLIGEVFDQFDLLVGEWSNFLAIDGNRADQAILFQHWYVDMGPYTPKLNRSNNCRRASFNVGLGCRHVRDVRDLPRFGKTAKAAARRGMDYRLAAELFSKRTWRVVKCSTTEPLSFAQPENSKLGFTNAGRVLKHGLECRLQLARRGADNAQHFGGGRLLLQRFAQLVQERARSRWQ